MHLQWTKVLALGAALAGCLAVAPALARGEGEPAGGDAPAAPAAAPASPPTEEAAPQPGEIWHEALLVTARRFSQSLGEIPFHSTVVEAQEVEDAPDSGVLDLLRQDPSLNLARDSGTLVAQPRDQAVSFRGVVGAVQSRALPLVDGLPIVDPYGGWTNFAVIPKELVDRVEIVRGGGSSAWGNLALSGVLNLITRAPGEDSLGLTARLGDRSTSELTAFYGDVGRRWSGWVAGNAFDTDGYYSLAPEFRGAAHQPNARSYASLNARLGRSSSPSTSWTLRALAFEEERDQETTIDLDKARERSLALTVDHVGAGGGVWQTQLFRRELDTDSFAGAVSADLAAVEPDSHLTGLPASTTGASALWSRSAGGRHTLSVGADWLGVAIERQQDLEWDGARFSSHYEVRGRQELRGIFLQDGVAASERWSFQLGARFDRVRNYDARSRRTSLLTGELTGEDPIADESASSFNPSAGFVWAASPRVRVRGGVYTGFRFGTPNELFIGSATAGGAITVPNAGLEPEELVGAEGGLDFTPSRALTLRVTGFRNEVENLIQRVLVGRTGATEEVIEPCGLVPARGRCFQQRNLGEIRSTGLELGIDYRPGQRWRWTLDASLMESRVTGNPEAPELVGRQVERAPDQQIAAAASYAHPRAGSWLLRGRYVSPAYDDAENTEYLPGHTLVDLSYSRSITSRVTAFAGVENLLDRRYVNRWTCGGPHRNGPRLVHVGIRFRSRGAG